MAWLGIQCFELWTDQNKPHEFSHINFFFGALGQITNHFYSASGLAYHQYKMGRWRSLND